MKHERANDRKITAGLKEGPGDRRVHFTLASPAAGLTWMHGQARHDAALSGKVFLSPGNRRRRLPETTAERRDILFAYRAPARNMAQVPDNQSLFRKER